MIARSPLDEQAALAELRARIAAVDQRKVAFERQIRQAVQAPISGTIASLNVRVGEAVEAGTVVATILPEGGALQAELFVPTRAAGFVEVGQDARLKLDAFPHQRFGLLEGTVSSVSAAVSMPAELPISIAETLPVYHSVVTLRRQTIEAHGRTFPLQVGMVVRADIIQEKRKLWQIVFEPFLTR